MRGEEGGRAVKVVITGPYAAGKTTLIRTISEITVLSTGRGTGEADRVRKAETTVVMDFGRITIDEDLVLYLFGTPGQERFDVMWEVLGEGMLGYVLVVDDSDRQSLHEAVAVLAAFRSMAQVPHVVALNRADTVGEDDEQRVRQVLDLPPGVAVVPCDATDRESVKQVMLTLLDGALRALDPVA